MKEEEILEEISYLKEGYEMMEKIFNMCLAKGNIKGATSAKDDMFAFEKALNIWQAKLKDLPKQNTTSADSS
ncbi:MAG: hypothetical protein MRY49_00370 [Candidatus Pacebacteria bacterium]|nr:hypothetical protein [Candidatus Paceibacterota bacterium]